MPPEAKSVTRTVFYRTLNVEGLEIFYREAGGKNDGIFTVEGAELFKRDIPSAELNLLDTGHFALEEEVDRIGSLMREFLDRTVKIQPVFEAA